MQHDFLADPIKLRQEQGWLKAHGTTLGADNGLGAAAGAVPVICSTELYAQHSYLLQPRAAQDA